MGSLALGSRAPEQRKIASLVQATNLSAAVSLPVDLENSADKEFLRKLFNCESNSVRRRSEPSVPKSLMR